jgi:biopolymer transport protein ExbD
MSALKTPLPERKRTYRFALTPLADAMFQLLIFFMLSTSLTPYSLITLRNAADGMEEQSELSGIGDDPAAPQTPPAGQGRVTFWTLGAGQLSVAGQVFDRDQLPDLADAVGSQDAPGTVVIIVTEEARVQDVASAMAALRNANVDSVQITTEGGT